MRLDEEEIIGAIVLMAIYAVVVFVLVATFATWLMWPVLSVLGFSFWDVVKFVIGVEIIGATIFGSKNND